jgi:enolase-phosphatase E1
VVFITGEEHIRVVLLDIEGTTTPIDFVHRTLFPYASNKVEPFLREHVHEAEIRSVVHDLRAQRGFDEMQGLRPPAWTRDSAEAPIRSSVAYVQWLISRDSKCTPLKTLQGKIWHQGFAAGELHGQVYTDVPPAFARWRKQQREIYIYSSGSVLAQQDLFRTVESGDLTPQIAGYLDTKIGVKTDAESYKKIAASVGRAAREFLFLSDAPREIEAARSAGMQATLCNRNAANPSGDGEDQVIHSFDEVFPD